MDKTEKIKKAIAFFETMDIIDYASGCTANSEIIYMPKKEWRALFMITKYVYGNPIETEAVVQNVPNTSEKMPYFEVAEDHCTFQTHLAEDDIVYGLGEQVRGMNKRGWKYKSCNFDNPNHEEDTMSLYGAHNFLLVSGQKTFGVFFDYAGMMTFDIGYTAHDLMTVTAEDGNLKVYLITGASEDVIVHQFRTLIGRSYIAPKWAFGYGQSRWGYQSEEDIRQVAAKHQAAGIGLDSIYLDIDYMERYKDFTVDNTRFPDLKQLQSDMMAQGIHLVPIIDAGVKIEEGYSVYEEGVAGNYFCKDADGNDFVGAVWPGRVHFPDFMKPETRRWFGDKYAVLLDMGIDGFWNDMNEPAIFYTEKRLESVMQRINELSKQNMGVDTFFEFKGLVEGISNNIEDYSTFYHDMNGKKVVHHKVHNLYGYQMTRAASEAFDRLSEDKRILMFSRASYIGAHRYGGIWQGDNKSWWSHLLMNLQMLPALNMAGFVFNGADTGGFGCDTTEDLVMRWLQLSVFTPLMRNHSAMGTREQELYQFGNMADTKKMIEIRYGLIPYIYSEYMKAVLQDTMMYRPLSFVYRTDAAAREVEDQLLLGDEVMIAPVYRQNANGRYVYLPEEMMLVRMRGLDDIETEILPKGHHYVQAKLHELVFFIRHGKKIPLCRAAQNTEALDTVHMQYLGWETADYALYEDDGVSKDYDIEKHIRMC